MLNFGNWVARLLASARSAPERTDAVTLPHISPARAKELTDQGAILIDIREAGEFASESIPGARNHPLSRLGHAALDAPGPVVVFLCKSGARTRMNAAALRSCVEAEAYILDGGIDAWKAAGLPIRRR